MLADPPLSSWHEQTAATLSDQLASDHPAAAQEQDYLPQSGMYQYHSVTAAAADQSWCVYHIACGAQTADIQEDASAAAAHGTAATLAPAYHVDPPHLLRPVDDDQAVPAAVAVLGFCVPGQQLS